MPTEHLPDQHAPVMAMPSSASTAEPPAKGDARVAWGTRMRDFLTDGSVAALCDEMARLTHVPIWLRDQSGEVIIPVWSEEDPGAATGEGAGVIGSGHPWSFVSEPVARRRAFEQLGVADDGTHESYAVPLRISMGMLGAIVCCLPRHILSAKVDSPEALRLQSIRRSIVLLASSVCDVCEAQVALRKRVRELEALYRLGSLLNAAGSVDHVLQVALDLAMQVIGADAGSIAVFAHPDGYLRGETPVVRVFRGLSPEWVADSRPLTLGAVLRKQALKGDVVAIGDMAEDGRIADPERVTSEGLHGLLATGLLDQGRPIGVIRLFTRVPRAFSEAEGDLLKAIAEHLASGVSKAQLRELRTEDERIQRQVRLAADVQRRMLPRHLPQIKPFDVAAHYAPSFELGGDFYDFLELGGHLGVLIGDVAGKGVAAALLMSAVRSAIRAHAQDLYHIDEVLSRANRALCRDTLDHEFATLWYGVVDPVSLKLTYCGAGHDWPLLAHVPADRAMEDRDIQRLTADGMALGIDPLQKYPVGTMMLQPRDVLVAFTDGLHDATDFEGRKFGGTRLRKALVELLAKEPKASAARIVEYIMAQVRQHTGMTPRIDDITVVVLKVGER